MRTVRTALLTRVHTPPGHLWFSVRKPIHFGQVAMVVAINWLSVMSVIDIRRSGLHTLATRDRSAAIPSPAAATTKITKTYDDQHRDRRVPIDSTRRREAAATG